MDFNLPYPNRIFHSTNNKDVYWTWILEGYFHTKNNRQYLNDIIARFLITFKEYNPRRINYNQLNIQNYTEHKLAEFSGLDSISIQRFIPSRAESFADYVFWSIKLYAEDYIRKFGSIELEYLTEWAEEQFQDKEMSTIKAKAKNIYFWYEERDFKIKAKSKYSYLEYKEKRISRFKEYSKNKTKQTLAAINKVVRKYKYLIYKYKNNISKLAALFNLSRNTIYKYLKDIKYLLAKVLHKSNINIITLFEDINTKIKNIKDIVNLVNYRVCLKE